MNRRKLAKKSKVMIIFAAMLTLLFSVNSFASNDNVGFKFRIASFYSNGQEADGRYRSTTNTNNQWKVQLVESEEGNKTYTDFWIELDDGTNVSDDLRVRQGDGPSYKNAYSQASKKTVYLTGENNNFNSVYYNVSGYWDEETWD